MNHFTISEEEYNRLNAARRQLSLITSLLIAYDDRQVVDIATSDLYDFVSAQESTIRDVIKAADARYEAQRGERQLNWLDWTYALKIASGDAIHTPNGAEEYVLDGLTKASRIDEDMGGVMALWIEILDKQKPASAHTATAKKPAPRKRQKLIDPDEAAAREKLVSKSRKQPETA